MHDETRKWIDEVLATPGYRAERLTTDLTIACELRREQLGMSYSDVARAMGVSRQHVHKLFSGTQNSTIGSLVKLAMALGCELNLSLGNPIPQAGAKGSSQPAKGAAKPAARAAKPKKGVRPVEQ